MRLQFIWGWEWQGFHFAKSAYGLALIYDWYLWLGFIEVRKWHNMKLGDIERRYQKED